LSKGLVTLKGVEARDNYIRFGEIQFEQTIYENNQPEPEWGGPDEWTFHYSDTYGDPIVIQLSGLDFDAIAVVRDALGGVLTPDSTSFVDGVWTSTFNYGTLPTYATYFIEVSHVDGVGSEGWGKYWLSVNDPSHDDTYIPAEGVVIDNTYGTTAGVTLLPTAARPLNEFNGNNGGGLRIFSNGAVSLTNLNAGDTAWGDGIHVVTKGAVTVQSTVSNRPVWASQNGGSGIYVRTNGLITLGNVQANDNQGSGADLDNALCEWDGSNWINCTGTGGVTLKGVSGRHNEFNNNQYFGLWINSRGAVLL